MKRGPFSSGFGGRRGRAFSLVELLLSITVLAILMVVVSMALDQTQKVVHSSKGKAEQFRDARLAFELLTRNLSQATLNTYWDYYYSATGTNQPPVGATTVIPSAYLRQSELQFLTDLTPHLLGQTTSGGPAAHPGHAVFFQAPLGASVSYVGLSGLLNARGYYVEFGDDSLDRPGFLNTSTTPLKYRYRLLEYRPPAEQVSANGVNYVGDAIYNTPSTWYQQNTTNATRVVADNVVLLLLSPQVTPDMAQTAQKTATWIAPNYRYNSLDADNSTPQVDAPTTSGSGAVSQGTQHLLPPLMCVTMVAIDEASAQRWAASRNNQAVDILGESGATFAMAAQYSSDLSLLKTYLTEQKLNYHVFTSTIVLRNAKWDANQF